MTTNSDGPPSWWLTPLAGAEAADAAKALDRGLSSAEAWARLLRDGPNTLRTQAQRSRLLQFLMRFANPLVIILLVASVVSAFTGELANFIIISCIVLLSVSLDFVQEYRANHGAEKLRQR